MLKAGLDLRIRAWPDQKNVESVRLPHLPSHVPCSEVLFYPSQAFRGPAASSQCIRVQRLAVFLGHVKYSKAFFESITRF
ncbi:hypothetical protein D3C76_1598590 [compost metagenome]